jgi:hypothetical protein
MNFLQEPTHKVRYLTKKAKSLKEILFSSVNRIKKLQVKINPISIFKNFNLHLRLNQCWLNVKSKINIFRHIRNAQSKFSLKILSAKQGIRSVQMTLYESKLSDFERLALQRGRKLRQKRESLQLDKSEVSQVTGVLVLQELEDGKDVFKIKDYHSLMNFYSIQDKKNKKD